VTDTAKPLRPKADTAKPLRPEHGHAVEGTVHVFPPADNDLLAAVQPDFQDVEPSGLLHDEVVSTKDYLSGVRRRLSGRIATCGLVCGRRR
jgi:hypothetical protein